MAIKVAELQFAREHFPNFCFLRERNAREPFQHPLMTTVRAKLTALDHRIFCGGFSYSTTITSGENEFRCGLATVLITGRGFDDIVPTLRTISVEDRKIIEFLCDTLVRADHARLLL